MVIFTSITEDKERLKAKRQLLSTQGTEEKVLEEGEAFLFVGGMVEIEMLEEGLLGCRVRLVIRS